MRGPCECGIESSDSLSHRVCYPIENDLKQGDILSPVLFNVSLEYAIMKVQETNLGLDMMAPIKYEYL